MIVSKSDPTIFTDNVLKYLIPATVTLVVFILGILAAWLKSNIERRRASVNLKNVIITWVPNTKKPVETLAASCLDFSKRLDQSDQLSAERFSFNALHVNKIADIDLVSMIRTFITNSTGDLKKKNNNLYKLISTIDFFDDVQNQIMAKYDEHYSHTNSLLDKWNISFIKFDNLNQKVHKKTADKSPERLKLEKETADVSNNWFAAIKKSPQNIRLTNKDLLVPYEKIVGEYLFNYGSSEGDLMELMSAVQDLKIIYNQWEASHLGYSEVFKGYNKSLIAIFNELSLSADYFNLKSKIRWFCS